MMDKEEYKKELVRMWDSVRDDKFKGRNNCEGVDCKKCPLHGFKYGCKSLLSTVEVYGAVEKWSEDHKPKKFKVSQLEYDILESIIKTIDSGFYFFECDSLLMDLVKKGYFEGATRGMDIKEYFDNCEVKEDV